MFTQTWKIEVSVDKHPDRMLDRVDLLKPERCIMIGNHYANMVHYVTQPLEDADETQTQVEMTCQIYTNACVTIPYVHHNGRNKRVGFV